MDIEALSFEEAFGQLEAVVQELEEGDLTLEESIALFERGMTLAQRCGEMLDEAELKVRQLVPGPEGEYEATEFEVDLEGLS